jgi:hypothetical protein
MIYRKGKFVKTQPWYLPHVLRWKRGSETAGRISKIRLDVHDFCDENFGKPSQTLVPRGWRQHWWWEVGTDYIYYCFETKEDAMAFKLRWG